MALARPPIRNYLMTLRLERIAELAIRSGSDGLRAEWRYLVMDSRRSNEREMFEMLCRRGGQLSRTLDGEAAELVLNVHRIPGEGGRDGPPGFGFSRRKAERPDEVDVPARDLAWHARQQLEE